MTQAIFFGTKHTKTNKTHICFWCSREIQKWSRTRQDVWKQLPKMVSKYYCQECEYLFDTQYTLRQFGQPFNPLKWQVWQMFPQYFQDHFFKKYPKEKRIIVLAELRKFVDDLLPFGWIKYLFAKITKKPLAFDRDDARQFAKTLEYTRKYWHFITKDSR